MESQSKLLDKAVEESEQLNRMARKTFLDDRPIVTSSSANIKIEYKEVENEIILHYALLNSGKRTAYNLTVHDAVIFMDTTKKLYIKEFAGKNKLEINRLLSGKDNLGLFRHPLDIQLKSYLNRENWIFVVLKINYEDLAANQFHEEFLIYISEDFSKTKKFSNATKSEYNEIMRFIKYVGLFKT